MLKVLNIVNLLVIISIFSFFSCSDSATSYYNKGLYWSEISKEKMKYDVAVRYCEKMEGFMPTIGELRSLIVNCSSTETGGPCPVTGSCSDFLDCYDFSCEGCSNANDGYSVFGDTEALWSLNEILKNSTSVWVLDFNNAKVMESMKSEDYRVRCLKLEEE